MKNQKAYAELIIKEGINVQNDQLVIINISVELYEFAKLLSEAAFKFGARDVIMNWNYQAFNRVRYDHASVDALTDIPKWFMDKNIYEADKDAAYISIVDYVPDVLAGADLSKISESNKAISKAIAYRRNRVMSNKNAWCVAAYPTVAWAEKVYPSLKGDAAFDMLWDAILKASRADGDNPITAWAEHSNTLVDRLNTLNDKQYKYLHYSSANGTDLKVGLPKNHIWCGGYENVIGKNYQFSANIPTEEVFTAPQYDDVNGTVYSTKPLIYKDNIIDEFYLTFKDGVVIDYDAKIGKDVLSSLLTIDEGAKRLGEVALVPHASPISEMNVLFYNTLFDENASCHFAVGQAYPTCVEGGADMCEDDLLKAGLNDSLTHNDFMVGNDTMCVKGITSDGTVEVILENGNFVF